MIWTKYAYLHWRTEEVKPFVVEVKYIKDKDIAIWRVTKGDVVLNKGKENHVIEAMKAASTYAQSVAKAIAVPVTKDIEFDAFKGYPEVSQLNN